MKKAALAVVVFFALCAVALAERECKDCGWYETHFQTVADNLKKSLNSPGRRSEYILGKLLVEMELIEFPCAMKVCAGQEIATKRIKLNYGSIKNIIYSGQVRSLKPE